MAGLSTKFASKTEVRIGEVCRAIRRCEFIHGESTYEFSKRWGVSVPQAQEIVKAAMKRVALELTDPLAVKGVVGARMTKIAMEGGPKDAINAARLLASMSGANAPTQHNVTVSAVHAMTPAERLERYKELTGHDWGKRLPEAQVVEEAVLVEEGSGGSND